MCKYVIQVTLGIYVDPIQIYSNSPSRRRDLPFGFFPSHIKYLVTKAVEHLE
jgi:hypothetical protein